MGEREIEVFRGERTQPLLQLLWYCVSQCQENNEIFIKTLKFNKAALEQLL